MDERVLHGDGKPTAGSDSKYQTPTHDAEPVVDGVIGILPIARGCMSDCSYCITKHATGKIDSPPVEENVEKARALVHAGARELRITGQDTGVYGWDDGERTLHVLLDRICSEIEGDFRVRVGMANPKGIHGIREELAEVFASHENLYNFLHVPVQSGSDDVLGDMRRQHQVREFVEVVETFEETLDEWTLSTDFIVGFPTETDHDFQQSMALLRETRPEKINVTRFSKRPGTDAAEMKGLGGTLKKERSKAMSERKREVVGDAYEGMVGEERSVLFVEDGTDDSLVGYDRAYRQVAVPEAESMGYQLGETVTCEITGHNTVYALGEPV
jgi:MiaB-like tRNA modifying enzyme